MSFDGMAEQAAGFKFDPPGLDRDRFLVENRAALSGPGVRGFLAIADLWDLGEQDKIAILGYPGRSTFHKWAREARNGKPMRLSVDTLCRISAILGIHKTLGILYLMPEEGPQWLRLPNRGPLFGGQRPLDLILSGTMDGIMQVRRYLDAQRGGQFAAPTTAPFEHEPWRADDVVIVE